MTLSIQERLNEERLKFPTLGTLSNDAWERYVQAGLCNDIDTLTFLRFYNAPPGLDILEVGAHDEPLANLLAERGDRVTGIDLREYDPRQDLPSKSTNKLDCNYNYIRGDFCNLPEVLYRQWLNHFDVVISLSAIEHFGLNAYNEGCPHPYYDVLAMRTVWQVLKTDGVAYISVPYGAWFIERHTNWRVYNYASLHSRLVQDFIVEAYSLVISGPLILDGELRTPRDTVTLEEANSYIGDPPHISILLKLRKKEVKRLSPDGR